MTKKHFVSGLLLALLPILFLSVAQAGWYTDTLIDPLDGKLDASKFLTEKKGVLPVPIIITEPAVGYGLGLALAFFHDPLAGKTEQGEEFNPNPEADGSLKPPSISALFGGETENGTWFGGGMHYGVWKNGNVRYTGVLARTNVNMDFYGLNGTGSTADAIGFNTKADILYQKILFRIKGSKFFAGADYSYFDADNQFDTGTSPNQAMLPGLTFSSTSASAGLILVYDGVDNPLSPGKGLKSMLKFNNYGSAWGGDDDFNKTRFFANYWQPIARNWTLAGRVDAAAITDTPPFYEYPFISLRGIPAMRYQGEAVLVAEIEALYKVTPRWRLIGFGGSGKTYSDIGTGDSDVIYSKGMGFRYLIARRFGLQVGLDVASGPEQNAVYLQVGSAWGR